MQQSSVRGELTIYEDDLNDINEPKNEDDLKHENSPKYEDNLKNESGLKNKDHLKNEGNLIRYLHDRRHAHCWNTHSGGHITLCGIFWFFAYLSLSSKTIFFLSYRGLLLFAKKGKRSMVPSYTV